MFNILTSSIIALCVFLAAYMYLPLGWLDKAPQHNFGSTITTIQASDTLSSSRAVINTNFSNLNTNKLQSGDTAASLTITSGTIGTLTLTNPLAIASGGTASTTISSNQVIIGNGSSGFKTVAGYGTASQVLTSNGSASAPTWQSISFDTTLNYSPTGQWTFNGASTTNFAISNYLKWNGQIYTICAGTGASSSVLMSNGSGSLCFDSLPVNTLNVSNPASSASASASTTVRTVVVPSNSLGTAKTIRIASLWDGTGSAGSSCYYGIAYGNGSATTTIGFGTNHILGMPTGLVRIDGSIVATSTTNGLALMHGGEYSLGVGVTGREYFQTGNYLSYNFAAQTYIYFIVNNGNASNCSLAGESVEFLQ